MKRHEFPTFLDWWAVNEAEYNALSYAEDGNPVPLADLIRSVGRLETGEARDFVADRLEGKPKQKGSKRTVAQQAKEFGILGMIWGIQRELECSEYKALHAFLDRYPDITDDIDTLKTYVRRAKATWKAISGREPPPRFRKGAIQNPDN
jgi:hypothetical protein